METNYTVPKCKTCKYFREKPSFTSWDDKTEWHHCENMPCFNRWFVQKDTSACEKYQKK